MSCGLGVCGSSSETVPLDTEVVLVHGHVEEAVVTPVGSPGVATDPVLLLGVSSDTVANN